MDARMKQRACLKDEGCWLRHRCASVLTVRPDEIFSPAQPQTHTEKALHTNTETVTAYRCVTMLEILSTECHLGSN